MDKQRTARCMAWFGDEPGLYAIDDCCNGYRRVLRFPASTQKFNLAMSDVEPLPHAPDACIDLEKTKVGYEIPFNRHLYVFKPLRPLADIDAELKGVTDRILTMIGGLRAWTNKP